MSSLKRLVVGLGSNIEDRARFLQQAREALASLWESVVYSEIYQTQPWGLLEQPQFLNQVGYGWTELKPIMILEQLKRIEKTMGRIEGPRYGPRIIDLDILYYEDWIFVSDMLTIPHPRLQERAFALVPLVQIMPEFVHPVYQRSQHSLLKQINPKPDQCSIWVP